jgi:hypothetical protein
MRRSPESIVRGVGIIFCKNGPGIAAIVGVRVQRLNSGRVQLNLYRPRIISQISGWGLIPVLV